MHRFLLSAILSFGMLAGAKASVTVNARGVSPNEVLAADGTFLAAGDLVRLGYFSSTANLATDNSFSDLNAIFTPIGEGMANAGSLSQTGNSGQTMDIDNNPGTGQFLGTFSGVSASYLPANTLLYMWVFNSSVAGSATQWGIYQAPSWVFPQDPGSVTMSLASPSISVIRGSSIGSGSNISYELANVAPVPEPSSVALMGGSVMGAALLLRRKRRDSASARAPVA